MYVPLFMHKSKIGMCLYFYAPPGAIDRTTRWSNTDAGQYEQIMSNVLKVKRQFIHRNS